MDLERHIKKWTGCSECWLHRSRESICFYRGDDPPLDVLFIGEAPGPVEDEAGAPFVGPSGQLLDKMIEEAGLDGVSYGFTNVVGCFPNLLGKIRRPTKEEVSSCWPRLQELIEVCYPWAIVFVGKVASQETRPIVSGMFKEIALYEMVHPAYLLRRGRKGVHYTEAIKLLREVHEDLQSVGS